MLPLNQNNSGTSIRDQVARGHLADRYRPGSVPPDELTVTHSGTAEAPAIRIDIAIPQPPRAALLLFRGMGALAALYGLVSWNRESFDSLFAATILAGIPFLLLHFERRTKRCLEITPTEIRWNDQSIFWGQLGSDAAEHNLLPLHTIEKVRVSSILLEWQVVISSDIGEMNVGAGLSKASAGWLRDYLISAIAHADSVRDSKNERTSGRPADG
jgi:hypothetical protein